MKCVFKHRNLQQSYMNQRDGWPCYNKFEPIRNQHQLQQCQPEGISPFNALGGNHGNNNILSVLDFEESLRGSQIYCRALY